MKKLNWAIGELAVAWVVSLMFIAFGNSERYAMLPSDLLMSGMIFPIAATGSMGLSLLAATGELELTCCQKYACRVFVLVSIFSVFIWGSFVVLDQLIELERGGVGF